MTASCRRESTRHVHDSAAGAWPLWERCPYDRSWPECGPLSATGFDRGCVKTRCTRVRRNIDLSERAVFDYFRARKGERTPENEMDARFHTASTHRGRCRRAGSRFQPRSRLPVPRPRWRDKQQGPKAGAAAFARSLRVGTTPAESTLQQWLRVLSRSALCGKRAARRRASGGPVVRRCLHRAHRRLQGDGRRLDRPGRSVDVGWQRGADRRSRRAAALVLIRLRECKVFTESKSCRDQFPRSAISCLSAGDSSSSLRATARSRSTVAASSVSAVGMSLKLLRSFSSGIALSETSMK
jgi:hypothetical protein